MEKTGELITDLSKLPADEVLFFASPYKTWDYWNGVLSIAMIKLYKQFDDEKYLNYVLSNYRFVFDNIELFKKLTTGKEFSGLRGLDYFWNITYMDKCAPMAAGMIAAYPYDKRKDYMGYFNLTSDYLFNKQIKLADGTYALDFPYANTTWADNLYIAVSFLCRMGNLTGERKYFDIAAKQVKLSNGYLYDKNTQLYRHCWYDDIKQQGVAHWGRANGWVAMAQADLLEYLPKNHPDRPELIRILKQQILGFSRYQSESGLWHQLLDKPDSYLETSCTAMFTYAVAKAVNEGWIEPRYKTIAEEGWKGIASMINEKGQVENICIGTGTSTSLVFYYKRPVITNDIHGLGAVLLAGSEVLKLPVEADRE